MIELQYDIELEIAEAPRRFAKKWTNKRITWQYMVNRCAKTKRTEETIKEYLKMSRDEQADIKDVGGFVGGFVADGSRKTENITYRTLATLDLDYANNEVWDEFTSQYGCAALLYSTHKHTKETPRFRLVIPFDRHVTPEEYEPICRRIAYNIGIEQFDITTYQLPRLFYWPSTSKNGEFVFEYQDGKPLNADEVLATYIDWRNVADWPTSLREGEVITKEVRKAGDPLEKSGLIGAFCRSYTIEEVIDKFLPDVYEPTAHEGRYTYIKGSVAAGLVCYEGKFAYSNHETDPASRMLCNAWDLVRIHKYGRLDEEAKPNTPINRRPSHLAMEEYARKDPGVKKEITQLHKKESDEMFANVLDDGDDWTQELTIDKHGDIEKNLHNQLAILFYDDEFKKVYFDLFRLRDFTTSEVFKGTAGSTADDESILKMTRYFNEKYNLSISANKMFELLQMTASERGVHPLKNYITSMQWDGVKRLETLLIDYLGAADTQLNRAFSRKWMVAAVARVFTPGCKFDHVLTLTGRQGIGKSMLFKTLGGEWFSDSLNLSGRDKAICEVINAAWIVELGELHGFGRADVEFVKSLLSKTSDIYRPAYGRVTKEFPRHCVFAATTNETHFLKGDTGNRRWWVVEVPGTGLVSNWIVKLRSAVPQLWAEAYHLYCQGETLYLDEELEAEARAVQFAFNEAGGDELIPAVQEFLDTLLPTDWSRRSLPERKSYFQCYSGLDADGVVHREYVTANTIIQEINDDRVRRGNGMARRINGILERLPDWEEVGRMKLPWKTEGEDVYSRRAFKYKGDLTPQKEGEEAI